MPLYRYSAVDLESRATSGLLEAESAREAREALRSRQLIATRLEPALSRRRFQLLRRLSQRDRQELTLATSQVATLIDTGTGSLKAIRTVARQVRNRRLRVALLSVAEDVKGGQSLAAALRRHPDFFDTVYVKMVEAGEASGELARTLRELSVYQERQLEVSSTVSAALTYPAFLAVVGLVVSAVLVGFVVPKIVRILAMRGRELPLPTKVLVAAGYVVSHYWWAILLGVFVACFAGMQTMKSPRARLVWDRLKLRLPLVGPLWHRQMLARWARTFAALLRSGVTVSDSLEILRDASGNTAFAAALCQVREEIQGGSTLASSAERLERFFPPVVVQMILVGEESGTLETILVELAQGLERHVDLTTRRLTSLLEPMLILVMGSLVGFIILAVLLPILQIQKVF